MPANLCVLLLEPKDVARVLKEPPRWSTYVGADLLGLDVRALVELGHCLNLDDRTCQFVFRDTGSDGTSSLWRMPDGLMAMLATVKGAAVDTLAQRWVLTESLRANRFTLASARAAITALRDLELRRQMMAVLDTPRQVMALQYLTGVAFDAAQRLRASADDRRQAEATARAAAELSLGVLENTPSF